MGYIQSGGTAYFLSVLKNQIYAPENHEIRTYTISSGQLLVDEEVIQDYKEDLSEIYYYHSETEGVNKELLSDNYRWSQLFDEYHKGEQIVFSGVNQDKSHDLYQQFINDQLKVDGKTYSETFGELIESGSSPNNYYYDVDEDGKEELLVDAWYGFEIYDIKNDTLQLLAFGGGTADICRLYRGNGHVYIAHLNFGSVGWECLTLERYDGQGNRTEYIYLYAEYEGDTYTDNGLYLYTQCNGSDYDEDLVYKERIEITKNQYVRHMETYTMIKPEEMKETYS